MSGKRAHMGAVIREVWGFRSLRPGQLEVLEAWSEGQDVLALLPTGGGKSLCYQVPALAERRVSGAMTIVVSPLISLMADQVGTLRGLGVSTAALNSQVDAGEQQDIEEAADAGLLDILYVSPERTMQPRFRRLLGGLSVGLIAIDEAHCVSQWGHDFRPEYRQLEALRCATNAPVLAVTATATPRVAEDIVASLDMKHALVVRGDFARPNLRFAVIQESSQRARVARVIAELRARGFDGQGSGRAIIYCASRKRVDSASEELRRCGFAVAGYHAGRGQEERMRTQRAFETRRVRVLVATNAFGMGVDYPDVRLVVHLQAPGSLEAYYQEAGRASRDGELGDCVLFFSAADAMLQRRLATTAGDRARTDDALRALEHYVNATTCRQRRLCEHFGADVGDWSCGVCDLCGPARAPSLAVEALETSNSLSAADLDTIVAAVANLSRPVGKVRLAQALCGSNAKALSRYGLLHLPEHGRLAGRHQKDIRVAIDELLESGRLARRGQKYPTVWLPNKAVRVAGRVRGENEKSPKRAAPKDRETRTNLLRALQLYRAKTAQKLGWKPYMVVHNKVLKQLDNNRPTTLLELETIDGLGPAKIDRFGFELLEIVRRYDEQRG